MVRDADPRPCPGSGRFQARVEEALGVIAGGGGDSMWNTNTQACLGLCSPQLPKPLPPWWPQAAVGMQSWEASLCRIVETPWETPAPNKTDGAIRCQNPSQEWKLDGKQPPGGRTPTAHLITMETDSISHQGTA